MEQNKKELMLWEAYKIIRNVINSDLNEIQILINREINDRNKKTHNKERF